MSEARRRVVVVAAALLYAAVTAVCVTLGQQHVGLRQSNVSTLLGPPATFLYMLNIATVLVFAVETAIVVLVARCVTRGISADRIIWASILICVWCLFGALAKGCTLWI